MRLADEWISFAFMCGIVGIWRHDNGIADPRDLAPMLAAILHRGPDDGGTWEKGRVALGHRRLTILDLTTGSHQPMVSPNGTGVLVYNGEVYNYRDLRRELEREGVEFHTTGDVEVVLQALHHWGPAQSIPRFNGMFALAYLDLRAEALWLARDRLGIKPLVVYQSGSELVFASEVKALLAHPRVVRRADGRATTAWLLGRPRQSHRTMFDGIGGVEAGTWWKVTNDGIERRRYFHILDDLDVERLVAARDAPPAQSIEGFRSVLKGSVRLHLASDVPLAAMCSGGVDSSLITAYAKEFCPDIQAYVADVVGNESEAPQAERVARHLGIRVTRVPVDRQKFLRLWPHAVWFSEGPSHRPSDPALLAVAQACRADGIKVLLTGEGSDELFGGYDWQSATFRQWRRLHRPWRRLLRHWFRGRDLFRLDRAPFFSLPARGDPEFRLRLMTGMDAEIELLPRRLLRLLAPIQPPEDRAFLAQCFADLYGNLATLLHRHDRMGMAASMEMRVPFLENGVFDLAFHLPRHAKLHRGMAKWVVKMAAAEVLPADVVHAQKKGFPMPVAFTRGTERLMLDGLLKEHMEWSSETLHEILVMLREDAVLCFYVTGLEIWMRLYFGSEKPEPLGERLLALAS